MYAAGLGSGVQTLRRAQAGNTAQDKHQGHQRSIAACPAGTRCTARGREQLAGSRGGHARGGVRGARDWVTCPVLSCREADGLLRRSSASMSRLFRSSTPLFWTTGFTTSCSASNARQPNRPPRPCTRAHAHRAHAHRAHAHRAHAHRAHAHRAHAHRAHAQAGRAGTGRDPRSRRSGAAGLGMFGLLLGPEERCLEVNLHRRAPKEAVSSKPHASGQTALAARRRCARAEQPLPPAPSHAACVAPFARHPLAHR